MTKLKVCPHCGGEVAIAWIVGLDALKCDKCGIVTILPQSGVGGEKLLEVFNTSTPEIVQCGGCKHSFSRDGRKPYGCYLHGKNKITLHLADDFCSYGERREENAKKK